MNENRSSLVVGLSGLKRTEQEERRGKKRNLNDKKLLLLFHFLNLNPIIGQSYIIMVIFFI